MHVLSSLQTVYLTSSAPQSDPLSSEAKGSKAKTSEPNIDFELDVKVDINSGKCVLHTKEPSKEDELKM